MQCIRMNQIKLPLTHTEEELKEKIIQLLNIRPENFVRFSLVKQSVDAREKSNIRYVYTVDVFLNNYKKVSKKLYGQNIALIEQEEYRFTPSGTEQLQQRPVIAGFGPAGIFCAYYLAKQGYRPLVIERGEPVDLRQKTVDAFWDTGTLDTESNVQFGEGGAGTFSDGKLNTMVKDKSGRNREVLKTFVRFGAKEEILYQNKPHIGTDALKGIVKNMREEIIACGGEIRFKSKLTDLCFSDNNGKQKLTGIIVNGLEQIDTEVLILAVGHSARDTFEMLKERKISMTAKSFAVGVRMEHPQTMINGAMYGVDRHEILEAADYKVTYNTPERGIYSFCMCPGGYVVNASSEEGQTAVNGMSYSDRGGENANSAIIVTVTPKDYGTEDVLDGMRFQRKLEQAAYKEGKGKVPVQCFGDFCENRTTTQFGEVHPAIKGGYAMANLRNVLPEFLSQPLMEGIHGFSRQIPGFDRADAVLSGVETRTSSPVRIDRDEHMFSLGAEGIYPCGEGAGYAGGITSAAMDGIRIYEAVAQRYAPIDENERQEQNSHE